VLPRVYDDVVEAMADVVERDLEPWESASGRRTAVTSAALLMALTAVALFLHPSTSSRALSAVGALILTGGAIVVSRAQRQGEVAVAMAWLGAAFAIVTGFMLAPPGPVFGLPMACAGAGASIAGMASLVGLRERRTMMIPPVVTGAFFLASGLVIRVALIDPAVVLTTALTLVVMIGSSFPWLALGATGTTVHQLRSVQDIAAEPDVVDVDRVRADARLAHQILVALSVTVGLLLVVIAPLAVSLGLSGTLLAGGSCVVALLRTRHHRTRLQVLVGMVAGIAGSSSVAVSLLCLHPGWRATTAGALAATGATLLAVTLLPSPPSARWERAGDLAEVVALMALLPLLVVATGTFAAIRG
jgi:hypothetical protein